MRGLPSAPRRVFLPFRTMNWTPARPMLHRLASGCPLPFWFIRSICGLVPCVRLRRGSCAGQDFWCRWRIRSMREFACAVQPCARWRTWYGSSCARTPYPRRPPAGHIRETVLPGWRTCRRCRISNTQTATSDQQSIQAAGPESDHPRSLCARFHHTVREPAPNRKSRGAPQPSHVVQVP